MVKYRFIVCSYPISEIDLADVIFVIGVYPPMDHLWGIPIIYNRIYLMNLAEIRIPWMTSPVPVE